MRCGIPVVFAASMLSTALWGGFLVASVQAEFVPVGYWALDDGQSNPNSTTAVDSAAPPASNGTLQNFPTPPPWLAGYSGGCLRFGASDRVNMGDPDELDLTGDLTLDFWLLPEGEGTSKYGPLVGKNNSGGPSGDAYAVDIVYDNSINGEAVSATLPKGTIEFIITSGDPGVNTLLRSSTPIPLNTTTWHHVCCEYVAGTRMTIYIDDAKDAELTTGVPAACNVTANNFALGNLGGTVDTYDYKGLMDEVRVYRGVIPEPACLVLLGSALIALVVRRRKVG